MSGRSLPLAVVLGLVAFACAQPPNPEVDFGSGTRFVPMVADALNDSGRLPAVVIGPDGRPLVAYFAFPEPTPEGTPPATRPVGSPSIPAVLLATVSEEGVWTHGAIAIEKQIPNVQIPFNPAFESSVADLTPGNVTGLQLAIDDQGGLHAIWGSAGGLFYAEGSSDPNATDPFRVERITSTPPIGPSLAVDGSGTPWIAFYTSSSKAASVQVATPGGDGWRIDRVATAAGCDTCRTATMAGADGVAVAYSDGGAGVYLATGDGQGGWESSEVAASGGQGLSGTPTPDGFALSFYDAGRVTVAAGAPGSLEGRPVSEVAPEAGSADGAGTSIAIGQDGTLFVAWSEAGGGVGLAAGDGSGFAPVDVADDTANGLTPSVAVDGGTAWVAWYDPIAQDLLLGGYGDLQGLALAEPSPTAATDGGPPTTAPPPRECTPVQNGVVTVVAEGIAFTDGSCIEAPAGEPFTITFDNRDAGVQHNVQIFGGPEPAGDPLFQGELVTGPVQVEYGVPALEPGEYAFNCLVHPNMVGTVRVVEPGGGQGGGGGGAPAVTVTAQSIAFDTSTIELAAGKATTIRFVNNDAGVQHNIAIYRDDSLSEELFSGELITGPAEIDYEIPPLEPGEYYFLCIVHPNMNGTVVVS